MAQKDIGLTSLAVFTFACLSAGTGACSTELSPAAHGQLAKGSFQYECVDSVSDPVCENLPNTLDIPFRTRLAEGATFSIWFSLHDYLPNQMGTQLVQSPLPSILEQSTEDGELTLRFLSPNYAPIHAVNMRDEIHDFIHLKGETVNSLMLAKMRVTTDNTWGDWDAKWEKLEDTLRLQSGELATIRVFPVDEDNHILAGTIQSYRWSPTDETVVISNPSSSSPTLYTLRAVAPGNTTLTASLSDLSTEISVIVDDAGDAGPDSGTLCASDKGRH